MSKLVFGLIVFMVLLTGCSPEEKKTGENNTSAPVEEKAPEIKLATFTENAWLRNALPEKTVMYLRIPNPWYYFTGIENGFKYAQQNEQHVQQLEAIRKGLNERIMSQLEPEMQPATSLFLKQMISPLEVAVLMDKDSPLAPVIVEAMKLDFESLDSFYENLHALLALEDIVEEIDPIDTNGHGAFVFPDTMNTCVYRFDPNTKEFLVAISSGVDKDSLHSILTGIKPISSHPMYDFERRIDTSKKGVFGYIDTKSLLPMIQNMIPPRAQISLNMSGLDQMNVLAFGYGDSQGKSRLKVIADMPNIGFRSYLPSVNNSFDFSARGSIDSLGLLSLPTKIQFNNIESIILSMSGYAPGYISLKQEFKAKTGIELGEIFDMIGPEVVYFSDEINDFTAVRLRNSEQFNQLIKKAADAGSIKYDEHKTGNLTIKHVVVPFADSLGIYDSLREESRNNPSLALFLSLLEKVDNHNYWVEENGFIIMANIPQPLIERAQRDDMVGVQSWLTDSQKQDMTNSLLAFTMNKKDLSRDYYYHYLQLLQILVDMSDSEIDFFALPHAGELKFAEHGSIGVSLESNEKYLALEASFEESPLDMFYAGGAYETAAVVGIMAAVAIPQFVEYKKRAEQLQ